MLQFLIKIFSNKHLLRSKQTMNNTFNFNRFFNLIRTEILINKKLYAILSLIVLFCISFGYYLIRQHDVMPTDAYASSIFNIILLLVFVAPLVFYINLYDSKKDVQRAMLPASQFEKLLSAIVQVSVLLPLLLFAIYVVSLTILSWINLPNLSINYSYYIENMFYNVQLQSFLFLAVFFFKNNKIIKIIITGIAIIVCFILLISLLEFILTQSQLKYIAQLNIRIDTKELMSIKIIWCILVPLLPWSLSYLKFKRTQI